MKTPKILLFVLLIVSTLAAYADWELYGPVTPPVFGGTYWSLSWGNSYPPLPCIPLRFINSDVYAILGATNKFVYDDTSDSLHGSSEMMTMDSEGGGSGGEGDGPTPLVDYGTNLFIQILDLENQLSDGGTQQVANLHLINTVPGKSYEILG